jgi:RHS repeat-associated protein
VVDFDYDHANRRTKLTYPSGTSTEYAYDSASRLTGLTYTHGGNTLGALTYAYDAASQRTQVGGSWARTGLPAALASATYNAANHQTAVGGQALTYDLNGNLTGDGTNTYTWNARNQLASISGPIAGSFVYDAFGRRQRTTVDGVITDVVYDGLNPVRQAVGATTVNLLTGLGIDEYLTRTDASSTRELLSDALGPTLTLTDSSGTLQTEYSYEPFGAVAASGSSSANEFRYTGREDDGTGLYYYRARYYHPQLQRFISEDPIGFAGGDPNLYSYVFNQPISFRDPTGLAVDPISWTAAAIMCGSGSVIGAVMAGRKATWDECLHYAGVGCAAGMLTLVSMIAAGGAVAVGTLPDIGLIGGTAGGAASAKTALEIAREGGKHSGFLRNYAGRSPTELRSAIASIERQVAQHRSWIANPESKIPNFRALDPRQQAALLIITANGQATSHDSRNN